MKTKMTKRPLKKAQSGTIIGAEQGKGAKVLRAAGKIIPTAGAAVLAGKAAINKIKNKRTQKRLEEEYMNKTQKANEQGMEDFKTGGMVNSNTKVSALKSAGSKGVKSGVNTKASASKKATGRSGGTSAAPKTAIPKAQLGRIVKTIGKGAKVVDTATDAAKNVKRANAAANAAGAAKKASGMKSFSNDMAAAFERMERKALKEKLIAADKASKKKRGGAIMRRK